MTTSDVSVRLASGDDALVLHRLIRQAFQARPTVSPPAQALHESVEDVRRMVDEGTGLIVSHGNEDVGALLMSFHGDSDVPYVMLHRVSVIPDVRRQGVATDMVTLAARMAAEAGFRYLRVMARSDLPHVVEWWQHHGFQIRSHVALGYLLEIRLPVAVTVPDAEAMRELGCNLADFLKPGDVIIATGELGAGKTTLAQGLAAGLDVDGAVVSPTFVLSRLHPPRSEGPQLVHVDAYRLHSAAELEDLDLDETLAQSVTFIEWGGRMARGLSDSWLELAIERSHDGKDETRMVYLAGYGERWQNVDFSGLGGDA